MTPAPPGSLHGNRITAIRWKNLIEQLGATVDITESWSGNEVDLLIALHAYRSHKSIVQFREKYADKPIVLMMTGTDLYRDIALHNEVIESMKIADKIIVLQSAALESIPQNFQDKVQVIYQSVDLGSIFKESSQDFLVTVIGHLREEKDPFCIARSLPLIPLDSKIEVKHLGGAMNTQMEITAQQYNATLKRYQWLGQVSHQDSLQMLSKSKLMVISSRMEGGAHVVSEAIALGIPVIATEIAGNRGLLGNDYPGYYAVGDEAALAALIDRAEKNPEFYGALQKQIESRQEFIKPEREKQSIQKLLIEFTGK